MESYSNYRVKESLHESYWSKLILTRFLFVNITSKKVIVRFDEIFQIFNHLKSNSKVILKILYPHANFDIVMHGAIDLFLPKLSLHLQKLRPLR